VRARRSSSGGGLCFREVDPVDAGSMTVDVERQPSAVVVHIAGEVDLTTAPTLAAKLREVVAGDGSAPRVVVDLARVTFLDMSGLTALMESSRVVERAGGCLVLAHPTRLVQRLLQITGLEDALPVSEE
jgi:anti-sigma B factor antagonist